MTLEHILAKKDIKKTHQLNVKSLLGNLTLIPQEENSRLNNNSFITKKYMKGGFNESTFMIDELVKKYEGEVWGEKEIIERTEWFVQKICEIWEESY